MFRLLILVLLLLAVVVPPASAQTAPVPLVSVNQDPALALLGDADGAKWLLGLGDWGLSFKSDNANTNKLNGVADTTFGGRTYRAKMRITNEGNLWISGRLQSRMPRVSLYRAANFNGVPNNDPTDVPWDGTEDDTWNMHTAGTELITIPYNGVWQIQFQVVFATEQAGIRTAAIRDPSGSANYLANIQRAVPGANTYLNASRPQRFEEGDQIRLEVTQTSGGAVAVVGNDVEDIGIATHLSVTMLSS